MLSLMKIFSKKPNADFYFKKGNQHLEQKNYELALADFNEAIKLENKFSKAYFNRGICHFELKNYDIAIADFNSGFQISPEIDCLLIFSGLSLITRMTMRHRPSLPSIPIDIAFLLPVVIILSPLIIIYHLYNRIKYRKFHTKSYLFRGICYLKLQEYEKAFSDFHKAIKLDPECSQAYAGLAECDLKNKNYESAIENFNKSIKLNYITPDIYSNLGVCYLELKKYNEALENCNFAIKLNPLDAKAYSSRGLCILELGSLEMEKLGLTFSLKTFIPSFRGLREIAALNDFNRAVELDSNDASIYNNRGICYTKKKEYHLAMLDYNKAIDLNCNYAQAYNNRGVCYSELRSYDLALNDFDSALKFFDTSESSSKAVGFSDGEIITPTTKVYLSEDKKQCCFLASNVAVTAKKYDAARNYIEKAFEYTDSKERLQHKDTYLKSIELIEAAQLNLEEKNKELNNLIAMFAHNFLGTLQCIRSNAEHANNKIIHLKTVKMMSGALTAFSIISADDDKLIEQLKQDNTGETNLLQNLANNLALAISQLLSKTNKDKIINLYLNYLRKTNQIEKDTTSEELRENRDYRKKWQALQHQWEDEFNDLFSENVELSSLQTWLADNFFPVQITGFDNYNIRFKEYGITDSIFLVVFMEILVNSLKYMDVSQNQPLILTLDKQDQHYHLICENPSSQETYRGTHKGMDFLKSIARKLNAQFITESTEKQFKTTFIIPAELLD